MNTTRAARDDGGTRVTGCKACLMQVRHVLAVGSHDVIILDVDRDPQGAVVVERHKGGIWRARTLAAGESVAAQRPRYRPHRDTCRSRGRGADEGPCAVCRKPCHRYGPGGNPLCEPCQLARTAALAQPG